MLACLVGLLLATVAHALEDADCFLCHGDPNVTKTTPEGEVVSLYIDEEAYAHSIHSPVGCVACHMDIEELPHPETLEKVNCGNCHLQMDEYEAGVHGKARAAGDGDVASCADCHGTHTIRPTDDPLSQVYPLNLPETCGRCHSDATLVKRHLVSISKPSEAYLHSVHARAIAEGNLDAAVCNDCHGAHDIRASNDPESPVYRANIATTCGQCHPAELAEYEMSIHGIALAAGRRDAPTCTDCHGEHEIISPGEPGSPVHQQMVSRATCPSCHDNEQIMTKYGVPTMRQASYMDSYHGMASTAGSNVVASCASCHGVHNILPASDPQSAIHPDNLVETCQKCHERAGPNWIAGPVHIIPTAPDQRALGIVRMIYLWAIAVIIGGMVLHNTLIMFRHFFGKFRREWKGPRVYQRFTRGQVFAHLVLSISFIALVISGFALRYPENWLMRMFFPGEGGLEMRGLVHRIAGVVLIVLMIVNIIYSVFMRSGRAELKALMVWPKDVRDIFRNVGYALGLCKRPPKYDRYSYSEKFEYWGMMWGSIIMIITGLFMWYAEAILEYFPGVPKLALDIAALIHFYEAWLALGTIVLWHFYYMIFDPQSYPMNWSWVTGNITEEDFKEHHPLEFERVTGQPAGEHESEKEGNGRDPIAAK